MSVPFFRTFLYQNPAGSRRRRRLRQAARIFLPPLFKFGPLVSAAAAATKAKIAAATTEATATAIDIATTKWAGWYRRYRFRESNEVTDKIDSHLPQISFTDRATNTYLSRQAYEQFYFRDLPTIYR